MGSQMMHSPNAHQGPPGHMMSNPMMMNNPGPRLNGPMGNPMGPHMMQNPNGPMHGISTPMHSPMNPGMPVGNGPMSGPMGSPMGGHGPPMNNGPMPQMNMNAPNGPIGPPLNNNFMMGPMNNMYPKPLPVSAGKVYPADQPMVIFFLCSLLKKKNYFFCIVANKFVFCKYLTCGASYVKYIYYQKYWL